VTYQKDCALPQEYLEQLSREGLDALPEMIRIIVNQAMELERQKHLGAARSLRQKYLNLTSLHRGIST